MTINLKTYPVDLDCFRGQARNCMDSSRDLSEADEEEEDGCEEDCRAFSDIVILWV